MNCLLFEKTEIGPDGSVEISGRRAKHILEILKASPGKRLKAGMINGPLGECEVISVEAGKVKGRCVFDSKSPVRREVDLVLCMPRPKVMKRLWAQLSALGVGRIFIINAGKVERNYFDTQWIDPKYYYPLLIEGLEQAVDTIVPEVAVKKRFKPFVEDELQEIFAGYKKILADASAGKSVRDALVKAEDKVVIAVGPEGGWTDYERGMLTDRGFVQASMGSRILRTDTAVVSLISSLSSFR